jgi:hypothetical protein
VLAALVRPLFTRRLCVMLAAIAPLPVLLPWRRAISTRERHD